MGFPEPLDVSVELSTPAQRFDEFLNVEDASSLPCIHQDAGCANEVPEAPRRSRHQPCKPKVFADYEANCCVRSNMICGTE